EMREKTGVGMKQPVGPARRSADVAMGVEHDESIIMLERPTRPRPGADGRNVERCFGGCVEQRPRERGALDRHEIPVSSFPFPAASAWPPRAPAKRDARTTNGTLEHNPWPSGWR